MNRKSVLRCGISVMLLSGVSAAPVAQLMDQKATDEVSRLKLELGFQNQKVENLLKRNRDLEAQVRQLQVQLVMEKTAQPGMEKKKIPSDWVGKEFNGTMYYVIPLNGGSPAPVIAK